jgi:capsid assembly protease
MKAFDAVLSQQWAIRPETLQQILDIAARTAPADIEAAARRLEERDRALEPEAVSAQPGTRLEGSRRSRVRGSTAVIPVEGPVFRYANLMTELSGATSIEMLAADFSTALRSPDVQSILLHIDSPGGQANGTGEFADMIYAARGQKPVWAYVSNDGASAAYWIASAAEKVITAPSAMLGSIGVAAVLPDPKRKDGKEIEFVSSQSPRKRPNVSTDEGRAQIQATVDALADVFVAGVARNRNRTVDEVLDGFGGGDVFVGQAAVDAGLADEVGSYEGALAELNAPKEEPAADLAPVQIKPPAAPARRAAMGLGERFEQFIAAVGGPVSDNEHAASEGVSGAVPASGLPVSPAPPPTGPVAQRSETLPEVQALRDRLAAMEAENRRIKAERIGELAQAFTEREITAGRAVPAEQAQMTALYVMAATDDANLGPIRQPDGSVTTRVAAVAAAYEARPSHNLTTEQLRAVQTHTALQALANLERAPGVENRPLTPEEKDALMARGGPVARQIAAERKNGGRN